MPTDKQNSSWLSAQFIITLSFALLTLKLNLNHFGKVNFGIWLALASIWGFGSALDLGFGTAIVKYVAEYQKYHKERISQLISSCFFVFLVSGVVIFLGANLVGELFYFYDDSFIGLELQSVFRSVFIILGLSFYLQYLIMFFKAIFEGMSDFVVTSRFTILQNTIILIGVVLITIFHFDIVVLAYLYLLASLILLLGYVLLFKNRYKEYRISIKSFNLKLVREILKFSFSVQTITIFNALIDPIIKYLISNYYNVGFVSVYEIARRFAIAISGLFFNAFRIVLPKASVLKSLDDIRSFVLNEIVKFTKIGLTYSGLAFGVFSLPVISVIYFMFGIEEAIVTFIILALPESINNFGYSIYTFLMGIGKIYLLVIVQFTNLIVVTISMIAGFILFESPIGLIGYFFSVLIGNVLMVLYFKFNLQIPLKKFFKEIKIYKLAMLIFLLIFSIVVLFNEFVSPFILFSIVGVLSYLVFMNEIKYYSEMFVNIIKGKIFNKTFS